MSPLDDQLRAAMHARADVLSPSPDPLGGIESRARGLKRRRVAASVAGAALAVAAVAVAVPSLVSGGSGGSGGTRPQYAATPSGESPLPANAMRQSAGDSGTASPALERKLVDAWASRHPGKGEVYAFVLVSGGTAKLHYAIVELWRSGGPAYAVVAQDTDQPTPTFVRDDVLAKGAAFIDGVVSGGGRGPFVVYAPAEGVVDVNYDAGDGKLLHKSWAIFPGDGRSGGILDRTGPRGGKDALIATYSDGRTVREDVWTGQSDQAGTADGEPSNLLADWPQRGDAADQAAERALVTRFAAAFSRSADTAKYRSLFNGHTASGLRYTVGQAWFTGETTAYTVSYATGGTNGPEFFLGRATDTTPVVVAAVLCCAPGATTDTLVVVPQPKTGQVDYTPTDPGGYSPAQAVAGGNGVYVIDRSRTPAGDRIRVLDGDGKLDHPTFEGPVGPLLCGYNSCG